MTTGQAPWPTCDVSYGHVPRLTCVLPRHHEMDGVKRHEDPSGTLWMMLGPEDDPWVMSGVLPG